MSTYQAEFLGVPVYTDDEELANILKKGGKAQGALADYNENILSALINARDDLQYRDPPVPVARFLLFKKRLIAMPSDEHPTAYPSMTYIIWPMLKSRRI